MLRSLIAGRFALLNVSEPSQSHSNTKLVDAPINDANNADDSASTSVTLIEYAQQRDRAGLLVTHELELAYERVKRNVEEIAAECRRRNSKFR